MYQSPDGNVCECCHPTVVAGGGRVFVMFRNSLGGNRDMYVVESGDNGDTFGRAKKLGLDSWQLDACPMDGGMLAVNNDGRVTSLWRRDRTVFVADSPSAAEVALGRGEQPWVASSGDHWLAAWTTKRNGELMVRASDDKEPSVLDSTAAFPVVVAHDAGKFLVAWEHQSGEHSDVRLQVVDEQ